MSKVKQAWLWFNSFMKYQFGGHGYRDAMCRRWITGEDGWLTKCTRCRHHFGSCKEL